MTHKTPLNQTLFCSLFTTATDLFAACSRKTTSPYLQRAAMCAPSGLTPPIPNKIGFLLSQILSGAGGVTKVSEVVAPANRAVLPRY